MFDVQSESLWSQFDGKARVGVMTGAVLDKIDFEIMTKAEIVKLGEKVSMMNFDTGFRRDYGVDPFADFLVSEEIIAPVTNSSSALGMKEKIAGFFINDNYLAVTVKSLKKRKKLLS
jgi:hypothetical protein